MNKKALYSILSTIVAMVVLSVSLVFAIGPRVSAMSTEGKVITLDKWEDFDIHDNGVLTGLSQNCLERLFAEYVYNPGCEYIDFRNPDEYDEIHVVIPEGVKSISNSDVYGYKWCGVFSPDYSSYRLGECITKIDLPSTLESIDGSRVFAYTGFTEITIPSGVTSVGDYAFDCCYSLTEIIVQNEDLLTNENLAPYADIMRYEAPKYTINFDSDGGNTIESQNVTRNENVIEPTAPTKDGYEFKGWFVGDEEYDFNTPVTEDMTLTAKWEAKQIQPEIPTEENAEVNNQNNSALTWGIAGTAAGILIIGGIVFGIVIAKRRRK